MMSPQLVELSTDSRRMELDCLLALACNSFDIPLIVLVLVGDRPIVAKKSADIDCGSIVEDVEFCQSALQNREPSILADAASDARFAGRRFAPGGPAVRFYAGVPIVLESGRPAGTLCLLDGVPRQLSEEQRRRLREVARIIGVLLVDALRARLIGNLTDALSERMQRARDDGATIARYRKMYERASALAHIGVWSGKAGGWGAR